MTTNRPVPSKRALPATVEDLRAQRLIQQNLKLIDEVDKAYQHLYSDPLFRALRGDPDPDETVEGSVQDDDTIAAAMVRDAGIELKMTLITKDTNLHDIRLKLRGAERRYNASRAQRAQAPPEQATG